MLKLASSFTRKSRHSSGKRYNSNSTSSIHIAKKSSKGRWLKALCAIGILSGGLYLADLAINDDLDQITELFRRRLSAEERKDRPHVVILGAGWGALSMLRKMHVDKFNVTVVSPRNYFLFTPLLPSTSSGSVSVRSIMEPIRKYLGRSDSQEAKFIEVEATDIDPVNQKIHCVDNSAIKGKVSEFDLDYDYLVVAVGAETATYGVPGVSDHSIYMKSIEDSQSMRQRVIDCFETSMIPGQPQEEIDRLLHFVVVGGGPSGVECTAELYDFVNDDLQKAFPEIADRAKISLVEALPNILPMFDKSLIEYVEKRFASTRNILLSCKSAVTKVDVTTLTIKDSEGTMKQIPYGLLLWVAGNSPRKLVSDLIQKLGHENHPIRRGLNVNDHMLVNGSKNIFALGDASVCGRLAPTAQVASQEGYYLGRLFNSLADDMYEEVKSKKSDKGENVVLNTFNDKNKFNYKHYGSFAYVGGGNAIADLSFASHQSSGHFTFLLWRSVYLSKLLSTRNRLYVLNDWIRSTIFGRDISRG